MKRKTIILTICYIIEKSDFRVYLFLNFKVIIPRRSFGFSSGKKKNEMKRSVIARVLSFCVLDGLCLCIQRETKPTSAKRKGVRQIKFNYYGAVRGVSFLQPRYFCLLRHVVCELFVK